MNNFKVKSEATTDPSYGVIPEKRNIETLLEKGVINLDKPEGPSSHQVSSWVKEILGLDKAGHAGTLDPKVSGVLPVTLERSTKAVKVLSESFKEYLALMQLHEEVPRTELEEVFDRFRGKIYQKPPVKAAVKRELRVREIFKLDIIEIRERYILFKVLCEAGTYIRKLCHDIGRALLTGGHMQDLRRIKVGPFEEENSISLHELKDSSVFYEKEGNEKYLRQNVLPLERMLDHLPKILIRDSAVDAVCHGANLAAPGISRLQSFEKGEKVAVMTLKGEAVAVSLAKMSSEKALKKEKGIVADTERVLMDPRTYPKGWR